MGGKRPGPGRDFLGRGRDIPGRKGSLEKLGWGEGVTCKGGGLSTESQSKGDGRGLGADGEG
jgi:hypothetical protein